MDGDGSANGRIYFYCYTDSGRTTQTSGSPQYLDLNGTYSMRYLIAASSYVGIPVSAGNFYTENLDLQEAVAPTNYTQSVLEQGAGAGAGMVLRENFSRKMGYKKSLTADSSSLHDNISKRAGFKMNLRER
jgi:hypothetical protein